ncbi:MAG TPA: response regulator [Armatimonadota bacterium]|nr:response regulator [Armatimonadota bacterium]
MTAAQNKAGSDGRRILVVDDSPTIRSLLRKTLALRAYEVEEAADGWDALALLERNPAFDLAIIDLLMPRLDGLSLVQRIRNNPGFPAMPIVILTGEDIDFAAGPPMGTDAVLVKPFAPRGLLDLVGRLCLKKMTDARASEPAGPG